MSLELLCCFLTTVGQRHQVPRALRTSKPKGHSSHLCVTGFANSEGCFMIIADFFNSILNTWYVYCTLMYLRRCLFRDECILPKPHDSCVITCRCFRHLSLLHPQTQVEKLAEGSKSDIPDPISGLNKLHLFSSPLSVYPLGFIMLTQPCSLWPICQTPLALSICLDSTYGHILTVFNWLFRCNWI